MSSHIPKQPKRQRDQISIKLDRDVLQRLEQYSRYLESSRDYIISAALDLVFRKDRAFTAWLETEVSAGDSERSTATTDRTLGHKPFRSMGPGRQRVIAGEDSGT